MGIFIKHLQLVFTHCCKIFGGKLHVRRQLVLSQAYIHANPNGGWNTARCERHCSWFFTQEVHCESTHFARDSHQFSKFMPRDKFFSNNLTRHFHGIFNRFSPGFNRILPSVTPFPRVFCRCTATILKARWLCSKARATVHQGADVLLEKGHVFFGKSHEKRGHYIVYLK